MWLVSDPDDLELAWAKQYQRLAAKLSRLLPCQGILVEIGCGRGQLTIPLFEKVPRLQIIGVDSFKGPYSSNHAELLSALSSLSSRVGFRVVVSNYSTWFASQPDSNYDAIISSEFLPEIDHRRMRSLFAHCHRVLKPGGKTFHSFLSPEPRNARQRRLIEADSDPRWTQTPPAEWFSPSSRLVLEYLRLAGFIKRRMTRLRSGLVIRSAAARQLFRDWDIRQSYWKFHEQVLEKEGLEIPDWIMIRAEKPPAHR